MWFVDNIDEIFSEFQKRKIEFADTLKTHAYGLKEFAFVDINGYYIRVAEGTDEDKRSKKLHRDSRRHLLNRWFPIHSLHKD